MRQQNFMEELEEDQIMPPIKNQSSQAKIDKYLVTSNPGIRHGLKPKLNTK
jgi:hypothetical protein